VIVTKLTSLTEVITSNVLFLMQFVTVATLRENSVVSCDQETLTIVRQWL